MSNRKSTTGEKVAVGAIVGGFLLWLVIVLGVLGVVVWAIITLVTHFTS